MKTDEKIYCANCAQNGKYIDVWGDMWKYNVYDVSLNNGGSIDKWWNKILTNEKIISNNNIIHEHQIRILEEKDKIKDAEIKELKEKIANLEKINDITNNTTNINNGTVQKVVIFKIMESIFISLIQWDRGSK